MMKLEVDDVDAWYEHVKKSSRKTNTVMPAPPNLK